MLLRHSSIPFIIVWEKPKVLVNHLKRTGSGWIKDGKEEMRPKMRDHTVHQISCSCVVEPEFKRESTQQQQNLSHLLKSHLLASRPLRASRHCQTPASAFPNTNYSFSLFSGSLTLAFAFHWFRKWKRSCDGNSYRSTSYEPTWQKICKKIGNTKMEWIMFIM